jgi:hypothetical protein
MEIYTPLESTYFLSVFFVVMFISLSLRFIYCKYKSTLVKLITLQFTLHE